MACRSETRALEAMNRIGGKNLEHIPLDLNDLNSVKEFAAVFNSKYDKLDILLNNAGIMALPKRESTVQGLEKQIGVNHFGHFLLTKLLLDKLKASPEGRVVNLSSLAHTSGKFNFEDLHWEKSYDAGQAYGRSKLANVYFSREFAKRVEGVKVCSVHPGAVRTELSRYIIDGFPCLVYSLLCLCSPLYFLMMKNVWWGTQTNLHCCLMPCSDIENGKYYADCKVKKETLCSTWESDAAKLWEISEETVKEFV